MKEITNKNNCWLCLKPEVYYVCKKNRVLLYNTKTGICKQTEDQTAIDILQELYSRKNPGSIPLDTPDTNLCPSFIRECISCGLIDSEPYVPERKRPVRLAPILNLQRDVDKMGQETGRSAGEDVLNYLADVTVHINGRCGHECTYCATFPNQICHCTRIPHVEEIELETLTLFFDQIGYVPLRRLFVTGGDILKHSHWNEFLHFFSSRGICPTLGLQYQNITKEDMKKLKEFPIHIFIDAPFDKSHLKNVATWTNSMDTHFQFSVTSIAGYNEIMQMVEECGISNYSVVPFYTETNLAFFEEQIFVDEKDIVSDPAEMRLLFARQRMNTHFFGRMMMFPNGDIKANFNGRLLGNIHQQHIATLIEKELISKVFWRYTRNAPPCTDCLFQFLCPSPSNYELALGKNNLCHVEK